MTYDAPTGPQDGPAQPGHPQQVPPPPGYSQQVPPPPPGYEQPAYAQPGYQAGFQQPGHAAPGQPVWGQPQLAVQQERTWASATHWSTILVGFLGPLVIMLTKGNESPFVRRQAAEALNFQITLIAGYVVSFVLMFVLIGFLTFFLLWAAGIAFAIVGAVKASSGEDYRYPVAIRMVS